MTDRLPTTDKKDEDEGLDWARITGFTLVVAIHAAALLLMLAPATPPEAEQQDDDATRVVIIEPRVFADGRGHFFESYHAERYAAAGLPDRFVQDNHSHSVVGTVRGGGAHHRAHRAGGSRPGNRDG